MTEFQCLDTLSPFHETLFSFFSLGRMRTMMCGLVLALLSGLGCVLAVNEWMYVVFRFLLAVTARSAALCSIVISRYHDDVIKWKKNPRYWTFVWGNHRSPVNSPHKGQWCGTLVFSTICAWINGWVNNREAGDLIRQRAHYYVTLMCVL